jgi:hypothetical protein
MMAGQENLTFSVSATWYRALGVTSRLLTLDGAGSKICLLVIEVSMKRAGSFGCSLLVVANSQSDCRACWLSFRLQRGGWRAHVSSAAEGLQVRRLACRFKTCVSRYCHAGMQRPSSPSRSLPFSSIRAWRSSDGRNDRVFELECLLLFGLLSRLDAHRGLDWRLT